MTEEWRDIKGYEGWYQVSNTGRVRSLDRVVVSKCGVKRFYPGREIVPCDAGKTYRNVPLSKGGFHRTPRLCRLVAEAFVPNPHGYNQVNHKDEDKTNDRADNLEWCSPKYNTNYGTGIARRAKTISIPVNQYSLEGRLIAKYESIKDAEAATEADNSHITRCCKGELKKTGGYKWKYAKEDDAT